MSQSIDSNDAKSCPDRELLFALSVGRLRGEVQDAVATHLQVCDLCLAELQSVDDGFEPLIADLRGPADPEPDDEYRPREPSWQSPGESIWGRSGRPLGEPAVLSSDCALPQQLGDYKLVEVLGRGGMGVVYRAWHTRLGQYRALKILRPERASDPRAIERFQREMATLGGLEHPNLVRAFDAREEAGVHFLVMEFVAGLDLNRLLERRGPLAVADACEVIRQAAVGLDHAYRARGIVHRDIKPSNLMITPAGSVKVLDLGVARINTSGQERLEQLGPSLTDIQEQVGTCDYMAPEQWLVCADVDIRMDVYGLGCTLYELLAGRAPYARLEWGTRQEKMLAHALVAPPPILESRADVPAELAAVLERMLAKSRRDRYATPAGVAQAVEPFAKGHDLAALLGPDSFVSTFSAIAEPSEADRTVEIETPTVPIPPRWWRPRWDWSQPPAFSKPVAVSAVLFLITLLLLAQTIWNRWHHAEPILTPAQAPIKQTHAPPPAVTVRRGDLVPASLTVRLYRLGARPDDLTDVGRIGDPRSGPQTAAVDELSVVIEAKFDEPLFPCLVAINPDGTRQTLFPEAGSATSARKDFQCPTGDRYMRLEKGMLGLILMGSRRPLSAQIMETIRLDTDAWRQTRTRTPWLFDGERCEPLARDRDGAFQKVSRGLKPFTDVCLAISSSPEVAAVRAIAFPVEAACKKPAPRALGEDDARRVTVLDQQISELQSKGQLAEAITPAREVLAIRLRGLGEDHPAVETSYESLASTLEGLGRSMEAASLRRNALTIRLKRRVGKGDNIAKIACYVDAIKLQQRRGNFAAARSLGLIAIEACRGIEHPDSLETAEVFTRLARLLANDGRPSDAEYLMRRASAIQHRVVPADDLQRAEVRTDAQRPPPMRGLPRASTGAEGKRRKPELISVGEFELILPRKPGSAVGRVSNLERLQTQLPADSALIAWLDPASQEGKSKADREHWACVIRRQGEPAWVRIKGSGPRGEWTADDDRRPLEASEAISQRPTDQTGRWRDVTDKLACQWLAPLEPHLASTSDLPPVTRLIFIPPQALAGVPIEALFDQRPDGQPRCTVSYTPSLLIYTHLRQKRSKGKSAKRSSEPAGLLALGDPVFTPTHDSRPRSSGLPADQKKSEHLASSLGEPPSALPGTRREVMAIAGLFDRPVTLLGSDASEERLDTLAREGRLREFRFLHFATHGKLDGQAAQRSALLLARDHLTDPLDQILAGQEVYDGELSAEQILRTWTLKAELVTISACWSGVGRLSIFGADLGFSHALILKGARSVVLSLWNVDDAATALVMTRFYQNLLGRRDGLKSPLPKADALSEAKIWLRTRTAAEVERLCQNLPAVERIDRVSGPRRSTAKAARPFDHPYYWAAFILIGDAE